MSSQQGKASPSPEAVHLPQSGFTHPLELVLDGRESILGLIVGSTDQIEEVAMKLRRGRSNNLEIDEHPVSGELFGDLIEQCSFAVVFEVVNGEPSYHHIKGSQWRQWVFQVPRSDIDSSFAPKSIPSMAEHGWR
jgi:hypothetical protein